MRPDVERIALDLAYEYTSQPVNWGRDGAETQMIARDGFVSGFEAGLAYALTAVTK